MKKISLLFFTLLIFQNFSFSQIELKGGLFASLPFGFLVTGEYGLYDDIGIEVGVGTNTGLKLGRGHVSGTTIMINARYYFSPNFGLDRFYCGLYLRPHTTVIKRELTNFIFPPIGPTSSSNSIESSRNSGMGIGLLIGKKFVRNNKYFIDFNIGFGRNVGRRVYDTDNISTIFGRSNEQIRSDFLFSMVIGYRL